MLDFLELFSESSRVQLQFLWTGMLWFGVNLRFDLMYFEFASSNSQDLAQDVALLGTCFGGFNFLCFCLDADLMDLWTIGSYITGVEHIKLCPRIILEFMGDHFHFSVICFTVVEKFLAILSFDFIEASWDHDAWNFKLWDLIFGEATFVFFFIFKWTLCYLWDLSSCPVWFKFLTLKKGYEVLEGY